MPVCRFSAEAERRISDLVIMLHWIASEVPDEAVAQRLRHIADSLDAQAMALRELWASGFGELA
jgi:hypothetical protein